MCQYMNNEQDRVLHEISPVYDTRSKILILGSFPSVKSREMNFFYGHPQNRFWKLLASLLGEEQPMTIEEKRAFLLRHHIAVWDVIESCTITGSSDSSIRDVVPNDLSPILNSADIQMIFCNGAASFKLYERYIKKTVYREAIKLPSTSPANAAYSLEKLAVYWKEILEYI